MRLSALVLLSALAASTASAKPQVGTARRFGERPSRDYESAQWFALEIKFGTYSPAIDSSPGVTGTPFADLFTEPGNPQQVPGFLLTQLEFDFQFLHKIGSLAVGVSLGYYRNTAKAFLYKDTAGSTPCAGASCERAGEDTALNIIPIELLLVYRFDYLLQRYRVPLVPYMKVGLAYYFWVIQNGSGGIATYLEDPATGQTSDGQGGTWGFTLHPGLQFTLDVIDPNAARIMDAELGINHSHLFIEMNYANISNFGRDNTMVLSDLSFAAGLAFEF